MDPITIGAGVLALARFLSSRNRRHEDKRHAVAHSGYARVTDDLERRTAGMLDAIDMLGRKRVEYTPRLLRQLVRSSKRLKQRLRDGGPSWTKPELDRLLAMADEVEMLRASAPPIISRDVSIAAWSVLAVQGLAELDKLHILSIPFLDDTVGETLHGALPDSIGHALDGFGMMDVPVIDVLGGFTLIFSVVRIGQNLSRASELKEANTRIEAAITEAEAKLSGIVAVENRSTRITNGLDQARYDAFKWSWVSGRLLHSLSRRNTRALRRAASLEREAASRFYAHINIPLLDKNGSVHSAPLPERRPELEIAA